ncbi:insecticidal toxin complex chitinase Chi1 [Yersinia nurmii]|uniref:chitinase n=1 Tax=Yersinia nurmii TaxID=685706 RepID=A0AAW7K418_9GAMM|nr:insecticidal toxin complex chitinase Chi1 [Yersinia nurmii]MDN0088292.1 insecticidal toxin complex chitinase Chi1 [Yersinia nurmii]CNE38000.1 Chitinase A precursor [Yersinia nurmii]
MEKEENSILIFDQDPGYVWDNKNECFGAAEETYNKLSYDPSKSVDKLTWTPTRLAKTVFNTYEDNDDFDVLCYFTDWAQYDARILNKDIRDTGGRSADILRLKTPNGKPFKRLIYSFGGLIGDTQYSADGNAGVAVRLGVANDTNDAIANHKGKAIPVDPDGAVLASINCGFTQWAAGEAHERYHEAEAKGLLGGFRQLHEADKDLEFSLSIGGWSMSGLFSEIAKSTTLRANFVEGIKDFFQRFPMFSHLDIDWEYPGSAGAGNPFDPTDGVNFATLIQEITNAKISNLKGISIASSADPAKIDAANIPDLMAAGVTGINLMTYDFFSLGDGKLSHHTNLHRDSNDTYSKYSIDDAVTHLIDKNNVNPKAIFIGYAGYTRNAKNATITTSTPSEEALEGTYTDANQTLGSFEHSVLEWTDIICHYMDFEKGEGRNGYKLVHDKVAKADYLYSEATKVFISLDTPRSVRDKGRYVKDRGLGGLFIWSGDQDNGMLTNAAHEGLGRRIKNNVIDMTPFYLDSDEELPIYTEPAEPQCEACNIK